MNTDKTISQILFILLVNGESVTNQTNRSYHLNINLFNEWDLWIVAYSIMKIKK